MQPILGNQAIVRELSLTQNKFAASVQPQKPVEDKLSGQASILVIVAGLENYSSFMQTYMKCCYFELLYPKNLKFCLHHDFVNQ